MTDLSTYLILDAAKTCGSASIGYKLNPKFEFLTYSENNDLSSCLFDFQFNSSFAEWFKKDGHGKGWGIFAVSDSRMEDLVLHLRKFLIVNSNEGNEMYFRLYDPRVLRVFLPTCDEDQLKVFFGPVKIFAVESEDSNFIIQFELVNGHLVSTRIPELEFWNQASKVQETERLSSSGAEISNEKNEAEKLVDAKPASQRKWNFLIDDN